MLKKIIPAVALLCVVAACKKSTCTDSDVKTYTLNQSKVNTLPYITGSDTLHFTDEQGAAFTFSAFRKAPYYNTSSSSDADCEGVNMKKQGAGIIYTDSVREVQFAYDYYVSATDSSDIQIAVFYVRESFVIDYNMLRFPYTKTMEINGVSYKDVYVKRENGSDSLYFSLKEGIIRLKLGDKILQK